VDAGDDLTERAFASGEVWAADQGIDADDFRSERLGAGDFWAVAFADRNRASLVLCA
jgi:hypothetical protein